MLRGQLLSALFLLLLHLLLLELHGLSRVAKQMILVLEGSISGLAERHEPCG